MRREIPNFILALSFILLYACTDTAIDSTNGIVLDIDYGHPDGTIRHFWKSTGFTPGENLLRPDMQQTCDFLGAAAHDAIIYIRPHYMLNLVGTKGIDTDRPEYNWTKLDSAMDVLLNNGLKPIFEIMGTPSASPTEFVSYISILDQNPF